MVGRDSGSEDYAMVLMTPLTGRDIVRGYVTASLARMRALLALAVGLMPALVVGSVQFFIMTAVIFFKIAISSPMSLGPNAGTSQPAPSEGIISDGLVSALFLVVMASGLVLLGAALGVFFGLVVRRPGPAAASAAGTLAGLITLGVVMFPMSTDFFPMLGDGALLAGAESWPCMLSRCGR
jgi:hypothetical protein